MEKIFRIVFFFFLKKKAGVEVGINVQFVLKRQAGKKMENKINGVGCGIILVRLNKYKNFNRQIRLFWKWE